MALDSLRHWVQAYGVDGFRFDLAPALARGDSRRGADSYKPDHPFLVAARADPVLQTVKLVAEPWDVGTHGWRTGQFPPPFGEWNDRFRDGVRSFWLSDAAHAPRRRRRAPPVRPARPRHPARRLVRPLRPSASADRVPRAAWASVNFVAAHDGFTLADLTAYERKHNEANGEGNRDGHGDNRSWNHGVEGGTDDDGVLRARHASGARAARHAAAVDRRADAARRRRDRPHPGRQQQRLLPRRRDDLGRLGPRRRRPRDLLEGTRTLLRLRRELAALRQAVRPSGRAVHPDGTTGPRLVRGDGSAMDHDRWHDPSLRTLQMFLHGHELDEPSSLVVVQGHHGDVEVTLPEAAVGRAVGAAVGQRLARGARVRRRRGRTRSRRPVAPASRSARAPSGVYRG